MIIFLLHLIISNIDWLVTLISFFMGFLYLTIVYVLCVPKEENYQLKVTFLILTGLLFLVVGILNYFTDYYRKLYFVCDLKSNNVSKQTFL